MASIGSLVEIARCGLRLGYWAAALTLLITTSGAQAGAATDPEDPRHRAQDAPRDWTRAVVRLETPIRHRGGDHPGHRIEHCTGTLVGGGPNPLLVTAWHCIEGQFDLTRPPRAEIDGRWYALRVLASGGSMAADWAVVTTVDPAPTPAVLPIHAGTLDLGARVTAGGFSRDDQLGAIGQHLTYHEDCRVIAAQRDDALSNCLAYKGASGGPVIVNDAEQGYRLAGVISAGDSLARSVLVPVSRFSRRLIALP